MIEANEVQQEATNSFPVTPIMKSTRLPTTTPIIPKELQQVVTNASTSPAAEVPITENNVTQRRTVTTRDNKTCMEDVATKRNETHLQKAATERDAMHGDEKVKKLNVTQPNENAANGRHQTPCDTTLPEHNVTKENVEEQHDRKTKRNENCLVIANAENATCMAANHRIYRS
jgi:hypothetical protein